jgi:hypothetical protein
MEACRKSALPYYICFGFFRIKFTRIFAMPAGMSNIYKRGNEKASPDADGRQDIQGFSCLKPCGTVA